MRRPRTEHDYRTMVKLAELRRSGASIRRIAGELGISPNTVAMPSKERAGAINMYGPAGIAVGLQYLGIVRSIFRTLCAKTSPFISR